MTWITEEEGSHFHFNYIYRSATVWLQPIVLKQKTFWKENKIRHVVVSACTDLLFTVYCATAQSAPYWEILASHGIWGRLEPMKKALFSLFLFILLGQLKCIVRLKTWDSISPSLQMFCIKRSRIINSDMQMYLFIYCPKEREPKTFLGGFRTLHTHSCPWMRAHAVLFPFLFHLDK